MSGQYEDEVNFMMRRLRLNFYRAEDMLLIYKRKQWAVKWILSEMSVFNIILLFDRRKMQNLRRSRTDARRRRRSG